MWVGASYTCPHPYEEGHAMGATLFNKITLYTTPFHEMDEDCFPVESYLDCVRELREDPDDRQLDYYRGTETQRRKHGIATAYTTSEAVEKKKAAIECSICRKKFESPKEKQGDHDHLTGKLRDILCIKCNAGIGFFQDNPELCETAAAYLRKWK
jgi:hypothetical protein